MASTVNALRVPFLGLFRQLLEASDRPERGGFSATAAEVRSRNPRSPMTVSAALEDLIRRMVTPCRESDSSRSVSWAAHREAEQLRDPRWVEVVLALLGSERDPQRRRACLSSELALKAIRSRSGGPR
jgi:hypothetical protein